MKTKMTAEQFEECQGKIADLKARVQTLLDVLDCAECCETATDLVANIDEAKDLVKEVGAELSELP